MGGCVWQLGCPATEGKRGGGGKEGGEEEGRREEGRVST